MKRLFLVLFLILLSFCTSPVSVDYGVNYGEDWQVYREYTCPDSADEYVEPGEDIQKVVDKSLPGTIIKIRSGRYYNQSIIPKDDMVFIGEVDTILDGTEETKHAFSGDAKNVVICGLTIEHYVPGPQMGAVRAGGHSQKENTAGWIIKKSEIRYNNGSGVRIGDGTHVLGNFIHHNSQTGIVGSGDNVLVRDNEISWNNFQNEFSYTWEAGGTKFVKTNNLVIDNNFVHHNWGPGLWTDIDNINVLLENNFVEDNAGNGIFHEISYKAVIRNNTVRRNGSDRAGAWAYGAGIMVASSPEVEVYDNLLVDNQNGIMGVQQDRGSGAHGPYRLDDIWVHDNFVVQLNSDSWAAGVVQNYGSKDVFYRNIKFDHNKYVIKSPSLDMFTWHGEDMSWFEWVYSLKHDINGSLEN